MSTLARMPTSHASENSPTGGATGDATERATDDVSGRATTDGARRAPSTGRATTNGGTTNGATTNGATTKGATRGTTSGADTTGGTGTGTGTGGTAGRSGGGRSSRRSYDQFCSVARALDAVGDRWTLLVVRELLAGPRRYTDLHADLPGVSTDVLAARLKHMEAEGLTARRRQPRPASGHVYELTERGRALLPVLTALATWGAPALGTPRPTDAVRAHWWAVPLHAVLSAELADRMGPVDVALPEGTFHLRLGPGTAGGPAYAEGPAPEGAGLRLELDATACAALADGTRTLAEAVRDGTVRVTGDGELPQALRSA
ncbi:hypothetical protein TPA0909_10200 [Streptomyces albus]|nr:hypothetical protein TPA0909_10200 [Streptomyces albus]